jgi:hypothetical protein
MTAWPAWAELEVWLAVLLLVGSVWWFWLGTRK